MERVCHCACRHESHCVWPWLKQPAQEENAFFDALWLSILVKLSVLGFLFFLSFFFFALEDVTLNALWRIFTQFPPIPPPVFLCVWLSNYLPQRDFTHSSQGCYIKHHVNLVLCLNCHTCMYYYRGASSQNCAASSSLRGTSPLSRVIAFYSCSPD